MILNFLSTDSNPFTANYTLGTLNLAMTSFIGVIGLTVPLAHIYIDLNKFLIFYGSSFRMVGLLIEGIQFSQQSAQVVILCCFYGFAEADLTD